MRRNVHIGLSFAVLSTLLTGCAGIPVLTSAIAGAIYVKSQTIERTFVAPMPEVQKACRQALTDMAFTIEHEELRETESYLLATASEKYKVEVTFTPITIETTRVMIKADSLPERDKATATEILNQMAIALSYPPPAEIPASTAGAVIPAVERFEPPPIPVIQSVDSAPPEPSPPPSAEDQPPIVVVASPSTGLTGALYEMPKGEVANGQLIYDTAVRDYIAGDFPAAIAHFRAYLATHPHGTERSGALYWLGESLYSQREYTDALIQFETILREYPQSPEAVRALLKGAHAYRQIGETRQATSMLQTLLKEHPDSREAQFARTLMAK